MNDDFAVRRGQFNDIPQNLILDGNDQLKPRIKIGDQTW